METRRVLRMTLATRDQSAIELESHGSAFMQYIRQMRLDLSRQWILVYEGRIISACTCIESPGRTAMLFLPESAQHPATLTQTADMVRHILAEEAARDIRLAQCLLNPTDTGLRAGLSSIGFSETAELIYMECPTAGALARSAAMTSPPQAEDGWITYSKDTHAAFADLILETYRNSLDCPGLGGLRDIEDIISGHKSAGVFKPHRWMIYHRGGVPAGCILLGESPLRPSLEVVYMGVHPAARGRGLGRTLLRKIIELAQAEGFERVTLAVDARNAPAIAIYRGFGFEICNRREAMICPLRANGPAV